MTNTVTATRWHVEATTGPGTRYINDDHGDTVAYARVSDADARLIAAAPELLAVLEGCLEYFDAQWARCTDADNCGSCVQCLVVAAIAKATGETR